jgi:Icc-related predicted phosphoesterase
MMRLLALSDMHSTLGNIEAVIDASPAVEGIILVGDLTQFGDYKDAQNVLTALGRLSRSIIGVPGNLDRSGVLTLLEESGFSLHGKGITIHGIGFFGVGGSNRTPFHTPLELREEEITRLLALGYSSIAQEKRKIMIAHAPPAHSRLDRTRSGAHAGSMAVRMFIEEHAVDVCLSGHIHEASGEETIHETRCYNIGAVKDGRYAIIEIDEEKIEVMRRNISLWT